jgi:hypothetical protein
MEQFYCKKNGRVRDTVIDFGDDGNGICHDQAATVGVCYSIQRAIRLCGDKQQLKQSYKTRYERRPFLGAGLPRIYRNVPTINQQK